MIRRVTAFAAVLLSVAAGCASGPTSGQRAGDAHVIAVGMPLAEVRERLAAVRARDITDNVGFRRQSAGNAAGALSPWDWYILPDNTCVNVFASAEEGRPPEGPIVKEIGVYERGVGLPDKRVRQVQSHPKSLDLSDCAPGPAPDGAADYTPIAVTSSPSPSPGTRERAG